VNPDVNVYTKTQNRRKTIRKTQKNNPLKTKIVLVSKYKVSRGLVVAFSLLGGAGRGGHPRQLRHCPKRSPFFKDKWMAEKGVNAYASNSHMFCMI